MQNLSKGMENVGKGMSETAATMGCISVFLLMVFLASLFVEFIGLLGIISVVCGWPCWCALCLCMSNGDPATNNNQRRVQQEHQYLLNGHQNGHEHES